MNNEAILCEINLIFRDVFDDDSLVITDGTNAEDIEDWDSLEQINLLVAMERRFKVKFTVAEVSNLKNVGEMVDLIFRKLA